MENFETMVLVLQRNNAVILMLFFLCPFFTICPSVVAPPPQSNCKQRRSPGLNQEAPTPELREVKKEEEELCSSQEDEPLIHQQAANAAICRESKDESQVSEEVNHLLRLRKDIQIPKIHLHRIGMMA